MRLMTALGTVPRSFVGGNPQPEPINQVKELERRAASGGGGGEGADLERLQTSHVQFKQVTL